MLSPFTDILLYLPSLRDVCIIVILKFEILSFTNLSALKDKGALHVLSLAY